MGTAGCTVDGHSHSVSSQKGRSLPFSHLHARGKRCGGWSWDGASSVHGARGQGPGRQQLQRWGGALGPCMRPTGRDRTRLVRQGRGGAGEDDGRTHGMGGNAPDRSTAVQQEYKITSPPHLFAFGCARLLRSRGSSHPWWGSSRQQHGGLAGYAPACASREAGKN